MLDSAEHKILNAHEYMYKNIKKAIFSSSDKPRMLFFLLIYVKMPTFVENLIEIWVFKKNFQTALSFSDL